MFRSWLKSFAFALSCTLAGCAFEDRVDHCSAQSDCASGQECYEGFCVRADDTSSRDDSVSGDDDEPRGGAGSGTGGRGGRSGGTSGTRGNGQSGGNGSPAPSGGTSASAGTGSDDGPRTDAGTPNGGGAPAAGSGASPGAGMSGAAGAGQSGGAAGAAGTPAADGGMTPGMPDPMSECMMSGPETCNGMDDDCDGTVDEQTTATCYPDGEAGCAQANGAWTCEGVCGLGTRACANGQLGNCIGHKTPAAEVCTAAGMQGADENCDGKTDETCACMAGEMRTCYSGREGTAGVGRCKAGTQTCDQGMLGMCTGAVTPGTETCGNMNVDDDCDGRMDNVPNLGGICVVPTNQGICRAGTLRCEAGNAEPTCVAVRPLPETCNNLDDDCNGRVDDGFNLQNDESNCGACGTRCANGETCTAGRCTAPMEPDPMEPDPMEPDPMEPGPMPGACSPACAAGQECCGGTCVDVSNDVRNCGRCGGACTAGAQPACCNGRCVDLVSNSNCGACGRDCSLLTDDNLTCTCTMGGDGRVACTGPVLNLCL